MSDLSPDPTPTNEQQDARGEHIVTVEFEEGYGQHVRMTCHAPADSMCHAEFDCECESWWNTGVEDGRPWHATDYDNPDAERHYGKFTPDFCNLREWFSNSDDPMSGSVSFPVEASFEGDYYSFEPAPLAAVSAAAPDEREALLAQAWEAAQARYPGESGLTDASRGAFVVGWSSALDAALAARPAPVVNGEAVERARDAVGALFDAAERAGFPDGPMTDDIVQAVLDAFGITVADAPAADPECICDGDRQHPIVERLRPRRGRCPVSPALPREERDAIRARAEAATDGPWRVMPARRGGQHLGVASGEWNHPNVVKAHEGADGYGSGTLRADAEFIAHARTDVPALLDALDAAEAEVAALRGRIEALADEARAEYADADDVIDEYCWVRVTDLTRALAADEGERAGR